MAKIIEKKFLYRVFCLQKAKSVILLTFLLSVFYGCINRPYQNEIKQLEELIWKDPNAATEKFCEIDTLNLPNCAQMQLKLLDMLLAIRIGNTCSPEEKLPEIIAFYQNFPNKDNETLAKAYYVQGVLYMLNGKHFEAMQVLKEAEALIDYLPKTLPYKCLIYYTEGSISENEHLCHISCDYYQQALQQAIAIQDTFRMAHCYCNIARMRSEYVDSLGLVYFNQAADYALAIKDTSLYCDIIIQREIHREQIDSAFILPYYQYAVEKYHLPILAHFPADYFLRRGNIREAQRYLDICAEDTLSYNWAREDYQQLLSREQALKGDYQGAYERMERLYSEMREQVYKDGMTRTFTISKMYDVEREKNISQQLTFHNKMLKTSICFISILFILTAIIAAIIIRKKKEQARVLLAQQTLEKEQAELSEKQAIYEKQQAILAKEQAEIKKKEIEIKQKQTAQQLKELNMELSEKRLLLLHSLKDRIKRTRQLQKHPDVPVDIPMESLITWLENKGYITSVDISLIIHQFNEIYGNLLESLRQEYQFTTKDLQYLALAILDLNLKEICFIMNNSEQTIRNRRHAIKERLGDTVQDLNEWIKKLRNNDEKIVLGDTE